MTVRIRLLRMGRKKRPFYHIVAVDGRKARDATRYLDKIGSYDPLKDPPDVSIDNAKALKWLKRGGSPSDTVRDIFKKKGVFKEFVEQKREIA